ncbi:MAG TPA: hypothetical protein VFK06_17865 [Candidatus Angelobacter sp.]|nr:hypothetical protein [Candidatus Angelobacter sp.]
MTIPDKPFHEMTPAEYELTAHSQAVPKWSILAIQPEQYSVSTICRYGADHVRALARVWGVNLSGSKIVVAEGIVRRRDVRAALSWETENTLSRKSRPVLTVIAQDAGVYRPWLNRRDLAALLIQWRCEERSRARREIARARHELLIMRAARAGLTVPRNNLERYGLDEHGNRQPAICGVPLSRALQVAPNAIASARDLSKDAFLRWIRSHPSAAATLTLIGTGILADGGVGFWRTVQEAFAPAEIPPLFASVE